MGKSEEGGDEIRHRVRKRGFGIVDQQHRSGSKRSVWFADDHRVAQEQEICSRKDY